MPAVERGHESAKIATAVLAHPLVDAAHVLHSFIGALAGEVETRRLVLELLDRGKQVICPRVVMGRDDLEHRRIGSLDDLVESELGLWEPHSDCEEVDLASLEAILVPGLAFDRKGGRLGMGRGYYDRLLARSDAPSIGLCYSRQLVDALPRGVRDIAMDWIVADETIDCRSAPGG